MPRPDGVAGSVMSTKPIRPASASVWMNVLPSSLTAEISATVGSAAAAPAGRFRYTGYVASRWNVSLADGDVHTGAGRGFGLAAAAVAPRPAHSTAVQVSVATARRDGRACGIEVPFDRCASRVSRTNVRIRAGG